MTRPRRRAPLDRGRVSDGDKPDLTYRDVIARTGLSYGTLRTLVCAKAIPHYRFSRNVVRFAARDIESWLAASAVEPMQNVGGPP